MPIPKRAVIAANPPTNAKRKQSVVSPVIVESIEVEGWHRRMASLEASANRPSLFYAAPGHLDACRGRTQIRLFRHAWEPQSFAVSDDVHLHLLVFPRPQLGEDLAEQDVQGFDVEGCEVVVEELGIVFVTHLFRLSSLLPVSRLWAARQSFGSSRNPVESSQLPTLDPA